MESSESSHAGRVHVIIYSRPGCHLCEEAKRAIQNAGCQDEYTLEEINIESDRELLRLYRYDIPVIMMNGVEAFRHRVTEEEFRKQLSETRQQSKDG
ncbi:MAG TPA: glutaredoxin family protein [Pyrinomonadaceae bacterium]|nr:glutaredoxin family protein [Pyrinomonadaceae bacterium]